MKIRNGNSNDLLAVKQLAIDSWSQFENELSPEHWDNLFQLLSSDATYQDLLINAISFICEDKDGQIVGMSYLVPGGNPTDIYSGEQCYIRFVTVSRDFNGMGIGKKLTEACIEHAIKSGETKIALHTSEFMNAARHIYEKLGFKVLREINPRFGKKYWLYEMSI